MLRSSLSRVSVIGRRLFSTQAPAAAQSGSSGTLAGAVVGLASGALAFKLWSEAQVAPVPVVDFQAVRNDIAALLDDDNYDDGSFGPVFVRLAWHAAGTFDKQNKTGGPKGATMRFHPECEHGANAGLHVARERLQTVKDKHPGLSYADLWSLSGVVAIEEMGGPKTPWKAGRADNSKPDTVPPTPQDRLPDASQGASHLRDVFGRMGFDDREIVALSGAHALGRCHTDRSGFKGPWTRAPTTFSNEYYRELIENKWTKKKWDGPEQFEDPSGDLMMLPTDMELIHDKGFRQWTELYAKDEVAFFKDFAAAFDKLQTLGV